MNTLKYPLEQLIQIKNKRFELALKLMEEKKQILEKEEKILLKVTKERDDIYNHKQDKLKQLRDSLDEGTTSDKIKQKKVYIDVVDERLKEKQKKVKAQEEVVKKANKEFEEAREAMLTKQKEVEKMKIHKEQWLKEVRFYEKKAEALEHDELGSIRHTIQSREKKDREK